MQAKEGRNLWGRRSRPGKKASGEVRPKPARGVKTLWGQEFNLVKGGLEEAQVVAYVEELNGRHSGAVEKLQQPRSLSELAGKVIFEAEKLADGIKEEERRHAAEQAAKIIFQAEMRSKQITDEAERAAALRLQNTSRLSIEVVGEAREKTTLAKERTRQQLPQQMANIQTALQAAIDQAYQKVLTDLMDLEREIQSRGAEERLRPAGALPAETTPAESRLETTKDEPKVSASFIHAPMPVEHQITAEEEDSHPSRAFEDEEALPALPGPTPYELSNSLGGTKEEDGYSSLGRDDVREEILKSLHQVIGSNGHGEALAAKGEATIDEQPAYGGSPNPGPETVVAMNVNGDVSKTGSDIYEGDLEFVMPPQRDGHEATNHLALLSALYMRVKKIPGASLLGTGGSEAEGNSIAVHFESPVRLAEVLKDVTMWEEERQGNGATRSGSLLGRLKSGKNLGDSQRKRILVTL
jgi:transcription termination factor NusB